MAESRAQRPVLPLPRSLATVDDAVARALSISFWLLGTVLAATLFPIAVVLWATTWPFDRRKVILHAFTNLWGSLYTWLNPVWSVRVRGREHIDPQGTYVMVSNHLSLADIFVVHRLHRHFKWVSKDRNFRIPWIGWNMRLNDYVPLRRGSKQSVQQMFARCREHLRAGSSVMMFPEGTRSTDGRLQPFRPGAFELAKQTGVAVLPIVIQGTFDAIEPRTLRVAPARMRVTVLRAIRDDEVEEMSAHQVGQLARERIAEHLERWPWPPRE